MRRIPLSGWIIIQIRIYKKASKKDNKIITFSGYRDHTMATDAELFLHSGRVKIWGESKKVGWGGGGGGGLLLVS